MYEHQLPNGEFACYYSPDAAMQEYCMPDSAVFPACLIVSCLLPFKEKANAKAICAAAVKFLTSQMMRGGVWNYFTRWHKLFKFCPADADDTVYASYVLRSLNVDIPDNKEVLLSNRNSKGLFYTWFVTRNVSHVFGKGRMVHLREFKYPLNSVLFWYTNEARRNDIDPVVNANILYYLGYNDDTIAIVEFLLRVLYEEQESERDKWYGNPISFYYFLSRNYTKVKQLEPGREIVVKRIYDNYNEDGSVGSSVLSTAMGLSALMNFENKDERIENVVNYILRSQHKTGYWDRNVFYYGGQSKKLGWGSEELTTAQCIEALYKYKASKNEL
ncbi:MAG: hypothetical protein C5B59_01735 [Bacteroidetes bacterium]|nr:MAG: hypothetical protein C5B59_01735 [Bacteroidota bacterium]